MLNVAINGLGRIGRATLKIVLDNPALRLTAVNDILPADNLAYLLKFDTVYGRWTREVHARDGRLNLDGIDYPVLSEREPAKLPWSRMGVDVVFECTGLFTRRDDLVKHIEAGARFVILSAPAKRGYPDSGPRSEPIAGGVSTDRFLRKLHDELHHTGCRNHGTKNRY
jgi:glyceraldehyde 3-phosphate dehydrogenase